MTHLSPSSDPNDDFTRYALAAKKHFSGSVLIAKDLMKFFDRYAGVGHSMLWRTATFVRNDVVMCGPKSEKGRP